jgi:hypothetical protein
MIITILDKWAKEDKDEMVVMTYIEVDEIDGERAIKFIENYETNAPDGEYNLDDMLYYLEKELGYEVNPVVRIDHAYF